MDALSRIGIFLEVARQESFAAAARELGITTSAVSKHVQNLEFEMQVKLLNRTTRKVSLTEEGAVYFERASRALDDLKEAAEEVNELKTTPSGSLRINVPMTFGVQHLARPIAEYARKYPQVKLDVQFDDRVIDMGQEGFDLSIRIGALRDSTMVARKLADCPIYACASAQYLARCGTPQTPDDLRNHNVLAYTRNRGAHEWRCRMPDGGERVIPLTSTFKADTAEMMIEAARQGIGIAIVPGFFVQDDVDNGRLVKLLPDYASAPERALWAIFPANRYLSTRLRLFVDHIAAYCAATFGK
jgi:DNA-binding transcriptional LysR family regulator